MGTRVTGTSITGTAITGTAVPDASADRAPQTDTLLEGLDDAQLTAVTSQAGILRILAGAGSGKTRVLTRRIAWRAAGSELDARRVLAITFTRKAAGELVSRLRTLGLDAEVTAGTFHSVAYSQLQIHWADSRATVPTVLESSSAFITRLLRSRHVQLHDDIDIDTNRAAVQLASEISWAKAKLIGPDTYVAQARRATRKTDLDATTIAELFEHYEKEKSSRRVIDLADLLSLYRTALEDDQAFRRAQQWKFRHLFIDEFQDLNPAQNAVLEALLGERDDLCVVGDPNQAIYSFNGAEPGLLTEFAQRHPGTETIVLRRNYRSTAQIIDASGSLLGPDRPVEATTGVDGGRARRVAEPTPTISSHPDEDAEAEAIADAVVARLGDGAPLSSQAVLVRTNAQIAAITKAFTSRGVSFRIRRDQAGRPELDSPVRDTDDPEDRSLTGGRDAVDISTFHAAKGLEWPVVHVAGIEDGLVPIAHASSPAQAAEEQRLLYVALSRAGRELHMSWSQTRAFGRRRVKRRRSPHLDTIESAISRTRDRSAKASRRTGTGHSRPGRDRADTTATGSGLLAELRTWRSSQAKAAGVPTYVIFHDATLDEIATTRPADRDDLLSITGIGPIKASRFGDDLLAIITKHDNDRTD